MLQKLKINKVVHHFYYSYIHGFASAQKEVLPALEKCFKKINGTEVIEKGDYSEFGIFKGYTFWYAQNHVATMNIKNMRFFGFDSFQGLPQVGEIDRTENNDFYKGQYSFSYDKVRKKLDGKDVDWGKTFLIEGFFCDTLNSDLKKKYLLKKIALALIDCDLYSSSVDVLNFIKDLVVDGTVLMFDDWNCFNKDNSKGQRRAMHEFLENNTQFFVEDFFSYGTWGQVFIIHKK